MTANFNAAAAYTHAYNEFASGRRRPQRLAVIKLSIHPQCIGLYVLLYAHIRQCTRAADYRFNGGDKHKTRHSKQPHDIGL